MQVDFTVKHLYISDPMHLSLHSLVQRRSVFTGCQHTMKHTYNEPEHDGAVELLLLVLLCLCVCSLCCEGDGRSLLLADFRVRLFVCLFV